MGSPRPNPAAAEAHPSACAHRPPSQITEGSDNADCEGIFAFLDSRIEAFKSSAFQSASKLTLLRTCNMLLKRLSKVSAVGNR